MNLNNVNARPMINECVPSEIPVCMCATRPRRTAILFSAAAFLFFISSLVAVEKSKLPADASGPATVRRIIESGWIDRAAVDPASAALAPDTHLTLWYRRPAQVWEEALPIGNGRLGAMVFGGVADERLQLNENSVWDGYPLDPANPEGLHALPEIRHLLFAGQNRQAVALAGKTMMGKPSRIKSYQPLGELLIETPHIDNVSAYQRRLDLNRAVVTTTYTHEGVTYTREAFATAVDDLIAVRFTASASNAISFTATLKRSQDARCSVATDDPCSLVLTGRINRTDAENKPRGIHFAARLTALASGGKVAASADRLKVTGANTVTLFIAGATSYPGLANITGPVDATDPIESCRDTLSKALAQSYETIKAAHIADYQHLFHRVAIDIGAAPAEVAALPTDERLARIKQSGMPDPDLVETHYQYGRYLLIGSSRPGAMPANLQGLWGWQMKMGS